LPSTFCGLTSRCTSPPAWAASRTAATCAAIFAARGLERALVREERPEVSPLDVAHGEKEEALASPGFMDGEDVRVYERAGQLGLPLEAGAKARLLRELRHDQLQGHGAVEGELPRPVDDAHAAAGDGPRCGSR
jgi:hypothetical protein